MTNMTEVYSEEMKREALTYLEAGYSEITIEMSDGSTTEIGDARNYVGWDEGIGWIADILGNVVYSSAKSVVDAVFNYIEKELGLTIIDIDF